MKKAKITVEKRVFLGKKVKKLRREGILPATIYGKNVKSMSVQLPAKEFDRLYKEVGETGLVEVSLDKELPRPAFIKHVQLDPISSLPLHADFYQVNLTEKVKAMVPVAALGEPKAVLDKVGVLLTPLSEIEVESLPTDVPEKIEVDVSHLAQVDEQIKVSDLKVTSGVVVLTEAEQILFKIGSLVTKEAEEQAKAEEAAAAAAAAEAGVAAGEAPVEGQAPTAEGEKLATAQAPKEAEPQKAQPEEKPQ
ncbi:50S ribosomal protein L25 [Candidatus Microgenomates bacterium]|nr:50S ribosomal protein L25 [Candidatus Microgenomates bacterium]